MLERACAQAGFAPRVDFEAAAPAVLVRLAARGLGVAVVPSGAESGAGPRADVDAGPASGTATGAGTGTATGLGSSSTGTGTGLCALRITEPRLTGRVALAWRTDGPPGPAAHTLLGRLRAQAPGRPAP